MPVDHIRYDLLAQEALRSVVRHVLADVAKNGVPGEHHFYVTFDTTAPGVKMSPRLRAQYPEEMRVVLQHQFWDLSVTEEVFEVGLSFGGIPERLLVPFAAVTAFVDPSVQFALQFTPIPEADGQAKDMAATDPAPAKPASREPARPGPALVEAARPQGKAQERPQEKPQAKPEEKPPQKSQEKPKDESDEPDPPTGGGEVVRLDRFRKK
jgi:hypothetical protein